MKILMVTNTYTPIIGGVERSIKSFTREYQKLGHEVLIITLEFDGMPEQEEGVVRVPAIRHFNGSDFSVRLPIPIQLTQILNTFKPDIVHSHHPFILGDTALRISNQYQIPLIFTHHTKYEDYTHYVPLDSPAMKNFVVELTSGYEELADYVIAPSQSIKDLIQSRRVKTPVKVIPTGVNYAHFSQGKREKFRQAYHIKEEDFLIGHIGRLAPEKNLIFLSRSIIAFLKQHPQAKFLLVGKGVLVEKLKEMFCEQGLSERLIYVGALTGQKLVDAYHAMDVFAFSSKSETQGVVLLEAMASGIPVVALNASGVNDVLKDKENGRIVFDEDVQSFTKALQWVLERQEEEYLSLQQMAQKTAFNLSIEKTAVQMIELYQSLLEKDFIYCDIENSPWAKALGRLKTEWELMNNLAEAVGAVIKNKLTQPPQKSFFNKLKQWFSYREWSVRIAGLSKVEQENPSPGIILIQIDGLAMKQIKKGIKEGRMPFLKKLLKKELYELYPFYSGQPSSTPGVQAELFYGVKGAVPSFSFLDSKTKEVFKMYNIDSAIEIEKRLSLENRGLLEGGSSYSNIYSGGAKETHFCAVDLGWDKIWQKIKPFKIAILGGIHIFSILQTIIRLIIEFFLSIFDFIEGLRQGKNFVKELKFILTRLGICILLRDLITFGVKIDIIRGLPIIHANFIGYDEHAHRRGASSKFAHWTLKGIDRCIEIIYKESLRSQRRKYTVWIYSDHGQEEVVSYANTYKTNIQKAVQQAFQEFQLQEDYLDYYREEGIQLQRDYFLGPRWLKNMMFFKAEKRNYPQKNKLVVTAMGPVGHIFFPRKLSEKEVESFAYKLVYDVHIPLVLRKGKNKEVVAWNEKGRFILPRDNREVFGAHHPFLNAVTDDMMRTVYHRNAGDFTISGWDAVKEMSWSFPVESGAHGGPGFHETKGFALLPKEILSLMKNNAYIRALDLHNMVLKFKNRV